MYTKLLVIVMLAILLVPSACLAVSYTGTLTYDLVPDPAANGLFVAGPNWPVEDQVWITWNVFTNPDSTWHYDYTFHTPGPGAAISHMIIEVSDEFEETDFFNFESDQAGMTSLLGEYSELNGNPGMPDTMKGIKFTASGFTEYTFGFDSYRRPVWGDFYAKCGAPPPDVNRSWNLGFTIADTDPLDAPSNGTVLNHILRPDTQIPEPGTMAMFGLGMTTLALMRRRKKS